MTCSAQNRNIIQGHVLGSLTLPFGKKETVAPELSYPADFFGWLQCGERPLMQLSAPDAPRSVGRQERELTLPWANHSQGSSLVTPNFQPSLSFYFRLNLSILGAAHISSTLCFFRGGRWRSLCWGVQTERTTCPAFPADQPSPAKVSQACQFPQICLSLQ